MAEVWAYTVLDVAVRQQVVPILILRVGVHDLIHVE